MNTTYSDLARERFAAELADAADDKLRSLAYSYLGLLDLRQHRADSAWQWKVDMVQNECEQRGRRDLFETERATVELERTA
jgi:hypothetical protein